LCGQIAAGNQSLESPDAHKGRQGNKSEGRMQPEYFAAHPCGMAFSFP
jgi:hypothetical protein